MASKTRVKPTSSDPTTRARKERFLLSSEDCELLMALETTGSTEGVAKQLARHASVISRHLVQLAGRAPVLEKPHGRWRLTATGARVVQWAREQSLAQERLVFAPSRVTIATTREFGARVVAPALDDLRARLGVSCVELVLVEAGVERAVLAGRVDVGMTCGRASDPAVAFRSLVEESYALVVPASWPKRGLAATFEQPHIQFTGAPAAKLLGLDRELTNVTGLFNDIAAVREACAGGAGWTVLPRYAVAREIESGQLRVVEGAVIPPDRFGTFWLRSRASALTWLPALCDWVASRPL